MDYITGPVWSDQPFTKSMPLPPQIANNPCIRCCIVAPKVRGIPTGATPLGEQETQDLLKKLEGNWHIQVGCGTESGLSYEPLIVLIVGFTGL